MEEDMGYLKKQSKKGNIIAMLNLGDRYREQYPKNLKKIEKAITLYKKVILFLDHELVKLRGNGKPSLKQETL